MCMHRQRQCSIIIYFDVFAYDVRIGIPVFTVRAMYTNNEFSYRETDLIRFFAFRTDGLDFPMFVVVHVITPA